MWRRSTSRHILCSAELKAGGLQKKTPTWVAGWAVALEPKTRVHATRLLLLNLRLDDFVGMVDDLAGEGAVARAHFGSRRPEMDTLPDS